MSTYDKKNIEQKAAKERYTKKQELADLRLILDTKSGRRFIWKYLGICGVFRSSFTGNSETFFKEGQRNVGLQLMAEVHEADIEMYALMSKENAEDNNQ